MQGPWDFGAPVWSPDGTQIAFATSMNATPPYLGSAGSNIWVMNADGSNPRQLTTSNMDDQPTWAPDGRIAFTSLRNDLNFDGDLTLSTALYVMNGDGSGQTQITFPASDELDRDPAWSPDGSTILYVHLGFGGTGYTSGYGEIYAIGPDGTGVRQVTSEAFEGGVPEHHFPRWSRDGRHIVFTGIGDFLFYFEPDAQGVLIWTMNADGSNEHHITSNNDEVTYFSAAWSPDGTRIVGTCAFPASAPASGQHICTMDPDGSGVQVVTQVGQHGYDSSPDWAPALRETNLTITDCNDPLLQQPTIPGSIAIVNDASCIVFNLAADSVGGNLDLLGDTATTTVNLGSLGSVGGNLDLGSDTAVTGVDLGSLRSVGGNLTLTGDTAATTFNLGSLIQVGGDVTLTGNTATTTINLGSLGVVGGNLDITENGGAAAVNLGNAVAVGGNLTLEAAATEVNLGNAQANGTETVVADGSNSVSATTGGTGTDISILGGVAEMRVTIPAGAFTTKVAFTITRLVDPSAESGATADGAPAAIGPIGGYQFSFAIPTLNADAQLGLAVDLSLLDPATRDAVLAGAQDGSATLVVKGDAPGSTYQAFVRCQGAATPQDSGCAAVTLLGADRSPTTDPAQAAYVLFNGVAGHFSTYAVALVTPLDLTPPSVAITLTGPNGGVADGQHGWFVSGPVTGTVQASKTSGRSGVTSLTCGTLSLILSGLGTQHATGTFVVGSEGVTPLVCSATDGAGNASPPVTLDVAVDRSGPVLAPTVTPSQVLLNGTATAAPNASDAISGVAAASCGAIDASATGPHTVTCSATDNAGNVTTATAAYTVIAPDTSCLGAPAHQVLPPIAADGSSVFVRGLPVPVRFRVCDPAGRSIKTRIVSRFRLVATMTDGVARSVNLPVRSALPDPDFFWDPLLREWDFLLATDVLEAGTTYVYDITLTDGSHIAFRFTLVAARDRVGGWPFVDFSLTTM